MLHIGKNIKHFRKRIGLTQHQLAEKLNVSCQAVSKWENDINRPDIELIPELATLLEISIDELFWDNSIKD